jgi:hypothetical protein
MSGVLPNYRRFHYIERRFSGFVALRIVVAGNTGGEDLGSKSLQRLGTMTL